MSEKSIFHPKYPLWFILDENRKIVRFKGGLESREVWGVLIFTDDDLAERFIRQQPNSSS